MEGKARACHRNQEGSPRVKQGFRSGDLECRDLPRASDRERQPRPDVGAEQRVHWESHLLCSFQCV